MVHVYKPKPIRIIFGGFLGFFGVVFVLVIIFGGSYLILDKNYEFDRWGLFGIVSLIIIFLVIFTYVISVIRMLSFKYIVADNFISSKYLFLSEGKIDIPFDQITNVDYTVSWFLDKVFGTGSILIHTAGTGGSDMKIHGILDVVSVYDEINSKLKLSKSIHISEDGVAYSEKSGVESKLIKRVRPNSKIAALMVVIVFVLPPLWFLLPFGIIAAIVTKFSYDKIYYDFYTDKIEYYDGFFNKNKKTVPLDRITNIDENATLFDRVFGVSTIMLDTAGGNMAEIRISYVKDARVIVAELKEVLEKYGRN